METKKKRLKDNLTPALNARLGRLADAESTGCSRSDRLFALMMQQYPIGDLFDELALLAEEALRELRTPTEADRSAGITVVVNRRERLLGVAEDAIQLIRDIETRIMEVMSLEKSRREAREKGLPPPRVRSSRRPGGGRDGTKGSQK